MRNIGILLGGVLIITIASCSESIDKTTPSNNEANKTESTVKSPVGRELTPDQKEGMRLIKRRHDNKKNSGAVSEKNMTSPYRYLISSDEYPIFTTLVKKSSINKYIHSGNVTVLAPVDDAFKVFPQYKELMLPGNEGLLDEFISYHVVNVGMEYKAFSEGSSWKTNTGESLKISRKGGVYFNGAHVRSGSIDTDNGSIIGMDDLIYFPKIVK